MSKPLLSSLLRRPAIAFLLLSTIIGTAGCGADATGASPSPLPESEAGADAAVPAAPARIARPSFCHPGFTPGDGGGCAPVLPSDACGDGSIPVLGTTDCRPTGVTVCAAWGEADGRGGCTPRIADSCPDDALTWADGTCMPIGQCRDTTIPWDPGLHAQHVDPSYTATDSDGSWEHPWRTIALANDAASDGDTIALMPGSYDEARITKSGVTIEGACLGTVRLQGGQHSALRIDSADRVTVRNVTVDGSLVFSGGSGHLVSQVIIHGGTLRASDVAGTVIEQTLVEDYPDVAIDVTNSEVTVRTTDIRRGAATSTGPLRAGILISGSLSDPWNPPQASSVYVRGCTISDALQNGILAYDSDVDVAATVIRGTKDYLTDHASGIRASATGMTMARVPALRVASSLVLDSASDGIRTSGYNVNMDGVIVKKSVEGAVHFSEGFSADGESDTAFPANTVMVSGSLIEGFFDYGIAVNDLDATIRNTIVRDIHSQFEPGGVGVVASTHGSTAHAGANLLLENSRLEASGGIALLAAAAVVTAEQCWILDTSGSAALLAEVPGTVAVVPKSASVGAPSVLTLRRCVVDSGANSAVISVASSLTLVDSAFGAFGGADKNARRALGVAAQAQDGVPTELAVDSCSFAGFSGATIAVHHSRATVAHSTLGATTASAEGANDGFGIAGLDGAEVRVEDTRVENAGRAAIAGSHAEMTVLDSELVCNPVDLAQDTTSGEATGTTCGCGDQSSWCTTSQDSVALDEVTPPDAP